MEGRRYLGCRLCLGVSNLKGDLSEMGFRLILSICAKGISKFREKAKRRIND